MNAIAPGRQAEARARKNAFLNEDLTRPTAAAWLTCGCLTANRPAFHCAISAKFLAFQADFRVSKNPLNIYVACQLTNFHRRPAHQCPDLFRAINHLRNLTNYQNTCANLAQDWKVAQVMQTRPTNWLNGGKLPPFSPDRTLLLSGGPCEARRRDGSARRSAWRSRRCGAPGRRTRRAGPAATGTAPWRRVRAWPLAEAPQASAC